MSLVFKVVNIDHVVLYSEGNIYVLPWAGLKNLQKYLYGIPHHCTIT